MNIQQIIGYTLLGGCGAALTVAAAKTLHTLAIYSIAFTPRILLDFRSWSMLYYDAFGFFGFNSRFFSDYGPVVATAGLLAGAGLGYFMARN